MMIYSALMKILTLSFINTAIFMCLQKIEGYALSPYTKENSFLFTNALYF
jgi:hypothetical protein